MRSAAAACLISPIGVVTEATRRFRASASDSSCAVSMSARRLRSSMPSNMRRSGPVVMSGIGHSVFLGGGTLGGPARRQCADSMATRSDQTTPFHSETAPMLTGTRSAGGKRVPVEGQPLRRLRREPFARQRVEPSQRSLRAAREGRSLLGMSRGTECLTRAVGHAPYLQPFRLTAPSSRRSTPVR